MADIQVVVDAVDSFSFHLFLPIGPNFLGPFFCSSEELSTTPPEISFDISRATGGWLATSNFAGTSYSETTSGCAAISQESGPNVPHSLAPFHVPTLWVRTTAPCLSRTVVHAGEFCVS